MRWRTIERFPRYEVSDTGLVRNRHTGRMLKPCLTGTKRQSGQRLSVSLQTEPQVFMGVGVLVLTAFDRPRKEGEVAMHKDDDTTNNVLENLQWGTHCDNTRDAAMKGRCPGQVLSKETYEMLLEMRAAGIPGKDVAALVGLSQQRVCDAYHGRTIWSRMT